MSIYHIALPANAKIQLKEGHDQLIVVADSVDDAKQVAKAYMGIPSDAAWASATVTAITEGTDLENWRARVTVKNTGGTVVERVTVTAASGDDFDDIGGDLATALNATASIAGAAYATPNLTVAGAGDSLGDHTIETAFLPPATWDDPEIILGSLFGTKTHEGAAGSALAVVMNSVKLPAVKYSVGS
jgi:hypothetical protein